MAIALHICSALGHADIIDYLLSELPLQIRQLNTVSNPQRLKAKGIKVQEIDYYDQELGLIEVALLGNQQDMLGYLLSKLSLLSICKIDPHSRLRSTEISDKTLYYEICAGSMDIGNWFQLAIKCGSYECVEILLRHFKTEIIRPLKSSIRDLFPSLVRSPRMFSLMETIEEFFHPALKWKIFEFHSDIATSNAEWDVDHVFSILDDSLQNLLLISADEDRHNTSSENILVCSSKPLIRNLLGKTEKWKIWKRHLLRLYLCLLGLIDILRNELRRNFSNYREFIVQREHEGKFEANTSHNKFASLVNSILIGFRRLMEIELAHTSIWFHAKLSDGGYYRIPPLTVLFSWEVTHLFSDAENLAGSPTIIYSLHASLSKLFEFFIEKHPYAAGDNVANELGFSGCAQAKSYRPELLQSIPLSNRMILDYAVSIICKSETFVNDSTFIEFFLRCLNYSTIIYEFWSSFSDINVPKGIRIVEFDYISYMPEITDPIWMLNHWRSYSELHSNALKSWNWAEQFLKKIIEPYIEKYSPLRIPRLFAQYIIHERTLYGQYDKFLNTVAVSNIIYYV